MSPKSKLTQQTHRETKITLGLTLLYGLMWVLGAYFAPNLGLKGRGILGFPWWFELSCIYAPLGFIALTAWVIKYYFKEVDLDSSDM